MVYKMHQDVLGSPVYLHLWLNHDRTTLAGRESGCTVMGVRDVAASSWLNERVDGQVLQIAPDFFS